MVLGGHDLPWCVTTGDDRAGAASGANCAPAASWHQRWPQRCLCCPAACTASRMPATATAPAALLSLVCYRLPLPPAGPLLCACFPDLAVQREHHNFAAQTNRHCPQMHPSVTQTHKLPPRTVPKEGTCTILSPCSTQPTGRTCVCAHEAHLGGEGDDGWRLTLALLVQQHIHA